MLKKFFSQGFWIILFLFLGLISFYAAFQDTQNSGDTYQFSPTFQVDRSLEFINEFGQLPHPRGSEEHERVRQGIISAIEDTQFTPIEMNYSFTYEDALQVGSYNTDDVLVTPTEVKNVLVFIDAPNTDDAVMFLAHYDSVPMGPGASDDLYGIASMLETLRQIDEGSFTLTNDIVFLFSDGEEEGLIGAFKFSTKATPINEVNDQYIDLIDHVKFLVNHESRGTGGTLIMFETTPCNYNSIQQFAAINKDIVTNSIANFIYQSMPNGTDYSAFSMLGIQGINVANVGEGYFYHTQGDNTARIDKSLMAQHGQLNSSVLDHFGTYDLSLLYETTGDAVFFNYLNFGMVVYSQPIAYLLMGVLFFLLAFHSWQLRRHKITIDLGKGMLALLVGIILSVASVLALTQLTQFVPNLYVRLTTSSYSSPALLFMALAFALAFTSLSWLVLHRWIKVSSKGIVLANTYLFAFLSLVLTLVQFEISYLFVIPTLIAAVLWIIQDLVSHKWLKVDLVPLATIIYLPLAMQLLVLAADALGAKMYAYIAILSLLTFGFVLPYILALPRKGWIRSGYALVVVLLAISGALGYLETEAPAGDGLSINLSGKASGRSVLFTDDSLIFSINQDTEQTEWSVVDKDAYRFMADELDALGFTYQTATSSYTLTNEDALNSLTEDAVSITSYSGYYEISITRYFDESFYLVTLPKEGVTKVDILENGHWTSFFDFSKMGEVIYFKGYNDATLKVYTSANPATILYEEFHQFDDQLLTFDWVQELQTQFTKLRLSTYIKETIEIE